MSFYGNPNGPSAPIGLPDEIDAKWSSTLPGASSSARAVAPPPRRYVSEFSSPSTDGSGRAGRAGRPGRAGPPPPTPPRTLSGSHHTRDGPTIVAPRGVTGARPPPPADDAPPTTAAGNDDAAEAVWRWRFEKRWTASARRVALGLTASDGGGGGLAEAAADDESRPPTRRGSGVLPQLPGDW